MTPVPYLLVDVFTDTQFDGNPLAVIIDPPPLSDDLMATIAGEFNLSETIYLTEAAPDRWDVRIFTPATELPFAGHPTVGAAIALAITGRVTGTDGTSTIVLAERAGDVPVDVRFAAGTAASATFTAPRTPTSDRTATETETIALLDALGLDADDALATLDVGVWSAGVPFTVVPLSSVDALGRASVDLAKLSAITTDLSANGLYLVAPADASGDHWRTRMFGPHLGITEDPATGSAACAAAGLLATLAADGEARWLLEQGVEMGRRSLLDLSATVRSGAAEQARLGGGAVLVGDGTLRLAAS